MAHHDCSELTPVRVYEVWPHIRDNAKPLTPQDAWKLLEARTYCPPSKAHIKRLQRPRPPISRQGPQRPADVAHRERFNDVAAMGNEAIAVARRALAVERHLIASTRPIVPDTHKPISPVANRVYHAAPTDAWPSMDELNERSARLDREFQQAVQAVRG